VVCTHNLYIELADAARASGFLFVSGEREKERNILSLCFFIFFFFFFLTGSGEYPLPPPGERGDGGRSLLASSIQGRKAAAQQLRCRSTKMPQSVFKTNWLLSTCI
jgi:hypothetical protein